MRPLRVGFMTPNLIQNGVYHWICDLAANTEVQRVEWCGALITGPRVPDPVCSAKLSRLMPLHCWQVPSWVAAFNLSDSIKIHAQAEDAYRTLSNADVIIAWELDEQLAWFFRAGIPVVLVSHSTWWKPSTDLTKQLAATVAVSQPAAVPFRLSGLEPTIIHSGLSWDRCASAAGRENVRRFWRAGPQHFVTACLDRHDPEKRPRMLPYIMRDLDYRHLGVMYGADGTGRPASWLVEESAGVERVVFHAPIENVGDVYSGADLIFTGSTNEAFGQVLIEGIASGKPVLCRNDLGILPELEQLAGQSLTFKFQETTNISEIAELIETIRESQPDQRAGQLFVREYLSARRGAARWTDYLNQFRKDKIPVSSWLRYQKTRWRTPNRPRRGLLVCQDYESLIRLTAPTPEVTWVSAFVLDSQSLLNQPRPRRLTVLSELDGPDWCHRQADLATAFRRLAATADFAMFETSDEVKRVYLNETTIPTAESLAEVTNLFTTVPELPALGAQLRAVFVCTPIGHGGTERWAEQLFERGAVSGIQWVGCCAVDGTSRNQKLVERFEQLGVEVVDCPNGRQTAADAIARWKPDLLVYTGLERIGQCIPPGYAGPVVSITHNSGFDYYTRAWVYSSDPFTSHSCAVSYLAAIAYPMERREDVVVLYPGVKACDFRSQRNAIRAELGFDPDDVVVCFAGRADPNKRPDLLAKAVADLPPKYKFLHIGNLAEWTGQEPYLDLLRRILPGRYRWLEFSDDLDQLLAGADILALCSQHESFGLVIMQALQQGCRVIGPSRSAVGEFRHDPAWAETPWTVFDGDEPKELAERIETLMARPTATVLPPVQRYFNADLAAANFHQFLRHTLKNPTGTGRVQLRQLRQTPVPVKALPDRAIVCDAVLPLGDDISQNLLSAQELLKQERTAVTLHVVGRAGLVEQLRNDLSDSRVKYYEAAPRSWIEAALLCRHALTSEYVLDASPSVRNEYERAHQMVMEVHNTGLECLIDTHDISFETGRSCFRRQTLIDHWLCGDRCDSLGDFQDRLIARGRSTRWTELRLAKARYPAVHTRFCTAALPIRPGEVSAVRCAAVLPFRGHVDWAEAALKSLLEQENASVTVHVVDDCSNSEEAEKFMLRIRSLQNVETYRSVRNVGQFMCANAVIARNQAECWLIQDADDISAPKRAWTTYHGLRESNSEIFTAPVLAFGGAMRMLEATYPYPGSWYFAINPVCGFTQGAFNQLGGYYDFNDTETNKASLDTDFFLRAAARDLPFYVAGQALLYYRQHIDSCTGNKEIGIGSPKRTALEHEITKRQVCETLRHIRGSYRACADLIRPF